MSSAQTEKGQRFRALHAASETFVIGNCWDGGSARVLGALGFKALATSSGASAGTLGRLDGQVTREEAAKALNVPCLFAPGLPDLASVRAVCSSVSKPVNFMVGIPGKSFSVSELTAAGVKRISLATSLYRAAMSGLIAAAREAVEQGTFEFVASAVSSRDLAAFLRGSAVLDAPGVNR
jgi:2-methylisocitrate lyase-like PEP mutase family enzyme